MSNFTYFRDGQLVETTVRIRGEIYKPDNSIAKAIVDGNILTDLSNIELSDVLIHSIATDTGLHPKEDWYEKEAFDKEDKPPEDK